MSKENKTSTLSIIVPVYNEQEVLPEFTEKLFQALRKSNILFEIIFVDDGSRDNSFEMINNLSQSDERIQGLRFSRNFGKESAMLAGLEHARGDCAIIMDGDGQHPPELIPDMISAWKIQKADVVRAVKKDRACDGLISRLRAGLFNSVMNRATGLDMTDASDFQLLDRKVINVILSMREKKRFFRAMSIWTGFKSVKIPFSVSPRLAGQSKWNSWQLARLAFDGLTSYTSKPLSFVMVIGLSGVLFSIILGAQAVWSWLQGVAVSGWTSMTILILFFGSANLLSIGMVGMYLARVFEEVKARPHYIVSEKTGKIGSD